MVRTLLSPKLILSPELISVLFDVLYPTILAKLKSVVSSFLIKETIWLKLPFEPKSIILPINPAYPAVCVIMPTEFISSS